MAELRLFRFVDRLRLEICQGIEIRCHDAGQTALCGSVLQCRYPVLDEGLPMRQIINMSPMSLPTLCLLWFKGYHPTSTSKDISWYPPATKQFAMKARFSSMICIDLPIKNADRMVIRLFPMEITSSWCSTTRWPISIAMMENSPCGLVIYIERLKHGDFPLCKQL